MGRVARIAHAKRPLTSPPSGLRKLEVGDVGAVANGGLLGSGTELAVFVGAVAVADGEAMGEVGGGGAAGDEAVVAVGLGLGAGLGMAALAVARRWWGL